MWIFFQLLSTLLCAPPLVLAASLIPLNVFVAVPDVVNDPSSPEYGPFQTLWKDNSSFFPEGTALYLKSEPDRAIDVERIGKKLSFLEGSTQEGGDSRALRAYNRLIPRAFKADLWRYLIIYENGGTYFDHKMRMVQPLGSWIDFESDSFVFPLYWQKGSLINGIFASSPQHKLLELIITTVVENIERSYYGRSWHFAPQFDITGPGAVQKALGLVPRDVNNGEGNFDKSVADCVEDRAFDVEDVKDVKRKAGGVANWRCDKCVEWALQAHR